MRVVSIMLAGLFLLGAAAGNAAAEPEGQKGSTYIGVKKCKMCHSKQFKTWKKMKHSKNFSQLKGDDAKDAKCLACHTTGYGKGGYDVAGDAENNKKFENVQCESCHGPGSKHMKAKKADRKKTITLKVTTCTGCHNPHVKQPAR